MSNRIKPYEPTENKLVEISSEPSTARRNSIENNKTMKEAFAFILSICAFSISFCLIFLYEDHHISGLYISNFLLITIISICWIRYLDNN